jgi:putative glutamine amidotransferase
MREPPLWLRRSEAPGQKRSPLIGVSGPERGGTPAWLFTRLALRRAGARVVRITPNRPFDPERLDGVVLGGGADITPDLDEVAEPAPPPSRLPWRRRALDLLIAPPLLLFRYLGATRNHAIDPARDRLEGRLIRHARAAGLPVLGICRGAQLMSVAEGGTLAHNLHTMYTERPQLYTALPRREVRVEPGSHLERILDRRAVLVNSLHFHAVDRPGDGMRVVAREPSGVIQAIEHTERPFWIGVQWHPEYLPQQPIHHRLFEALVEAARSRPGSTPEAASRPNT